MRGRPGEAPRAAVDRVGDKIEPSVPTPSDTLIDALLAGTLDLHDLPPHLRDLYQLGWIDGRQSLQDELEQANADADRYYVAAFSPRKHPTDLRSLAELERVRGHPARAEQLEASMAARFGDAA